jgi:cathepsin A (carboxypeptidase C)
MKYAFAAAALLPAALTLAHPGTGNQIPLGADVGQEQQLHHGHHHHSGHQSPLAAVVDSVAEHLKQLPQATRDLWAEVENMIPHNFDQMSVKSSPKKHTKRPDDHWDYHVSGEKVAVLGGEGKYEGDLDQYKLRGKKVDPSKLGVDPGVKQYSGYLDDEENDKHLFYWFFESRSNPKEDPVVLWLNGGPGCSSLTGLFMELGPSSVTKDGKLKYNPASWNNNASVIFLDQPVNVGYSYSGNAVSNTVAAGKDVYALLTLFFEQFPEYAKQDFHIAGESYAGHYIPVFAHEILSHKKRNINLKSVLIGNGLTDGLTQYEYYEPMACGKGGYPAVLSDGECQNMKSAYPRCASMIQNCYDSESVWSCVPASIYCNNVMMGPYQRTGTNVYDIRGPCKDSSNLCYPDLGWISSFLNKPDVIDALGAEVDGYESCNFDINRNFLFAGDWMKPYHKLVPDLLKEIPVLIYAGDADFICNWLGNHAWTEALEWPGKKAFNKVELGDFKMSDGGKCVGQIKSAEGLTFLRIFQAGHMTPMDQPESSLEFFNRWLRQKL